MFEKTSFDKLIKSVNYDYSSLTYYELLNTFEWESKRQLIIMRDGHDCKICKKGNTYKKITNGVIEYFWVTIPEKVRSYKNTFIDNGVLEQYLILDDRDFIFTKSDKHSFLHVHHKYYIKGTLPWEYKDECFETLCVHCHYDLHQKVKIPVFIKTPNGLFEKVELTTCKKCSGAGILPHFDYYMGGICFRCFGAKFEQFISEKFKKRSTEVYEMMKKYLD